jgi:hypothetical protein
MEFWRQASIKFKVIYIRREEKGREKTVIILDQTKHE